MRERGWWGVALAAVLTVACSGTKEESRAAPPVSTPASASASPTSAAASGGGSDHSTAGRPRVLFLGTSLTAGLGLDPDSAYPMLIQRRITAARLPWVVTNAGVSGETSADLLRRLGWVLQQPAGVIVVETGANDGLRGLDADATKATIGTVLDRIRAARPEASVYLVQMEAPTNMGADYTRRFHAMFPALAKEKGVTLIPFLLQGVAGVSRLNQADGIHPNDAGERIVAENVWRVLGRRLGRDKE